MKKICLLLLFLCIFPGMVGCAGGAPAKATTTQTNLYRPYMPYYDFDSLDEFYLYAVENERDPERFTKLEEGWSVDADGRLHYSQYISRLVRAEDVFSELDDEGGEFHVDGIIVGEYLFYQYKCSLGVTLRVFYGDAGIGEKYTVESSEQYGFWIMRLDGKVSGVRFFCGEDTYVNVWLPTDDAGREQIMSSSVAALKDLLSSDPAVVRARATEIAKGIGVTVYPNRGFGKK